MTFTISGYYQNAELNYEVETTDFEVFTLTSNQPVQDERFVPQRITLFRNIPNSNLLENHLLRLIDEWRNNME